MKVKGINELAQIIEYNNIVENHIKKAEKEIKKNRTNELIAEGVDNDK